MDLEIGLLSIIFLRIQDHFNIKRNIRKSHLGIIRRPLDTFFKHFEKYKECFIPGHQMDLIGFFDKVKDNRTLIKKFQRIIPNMGHYPNSYTGKELANQMILYLLILEEDPCCEKSRKYKIEDLRKTPFEIPFEIALKHFSNWIK